MTKISGIVIKGDGRAKKLSFPTANIPLNIDLTSGVYFGNVKIGEIVHKAIIFVGRSQKILEAHLLDFNGDLYDQKITIEVGEKIREVMNFKNDHELKKQIRKDIKMVKNLLESPRPARRGARDDKQFLCSRVSSKKYRGLKKPKK